MRITNQGVFPPSSQLSSLGKVLFPVFYFSLAHKYKLLKAVSLEQPTSSTEICSACMCLTSNQRAMQFAQEVEKMMDEWHQ